MDINTQIFYKKHFKCIISTLLLLFLTNCATNKTTTIATNQQIANPDKFEVFNRQAFAINMTFDREVLRPTAVWYANSLPDPLKFGINNFFNNLRDCVTLGNDIIQLEGMQTMQTTMRISINSTLGILGLIDVSTSIGLERHKNSFGKTMKTYGWKHSSYFVIPFIGPSTVRDALGLIPDVYFNPTWIVINSNLISVALFISDLIDTRSRYLDSDKILLTSLDPYITLRDYYMQAINEPITSNNEIKIDDLLEDTP